MGLQIRAIIVVTTITSLCAGLTTIRMKVRRGVRLELWHMTSARVRNKMECALLCASTVGCQAVDVRQQVDSADQQWLMCGMHDRYTANRALLKVDNSSTYMCK